MRGLSFVTPLAYDWRYAVLAIQSYYDIADEIVLGLDCDRISWSKKPFLFDEKAVAKFIAEIDVQKKIRIVQGNFHEHVGPMDNDTSERRQLGAACRRGNWVVQIDADEILVNPLEFRDYLTNLKPDVAVWATLIPVYKVIGDKALIVGGTPERITVATRSPQLFRCARITDQPYTRSPLRMLHLCWCRTEEELLQKLTNWGHSKEIDTEKFADMWRSTTLENYHRLKNFHFLHGPLWPFLEVIDWPPKSIFDACASDREAIGGTIQSSSCNPLIIHGKSACGAMVISFGAP